MEHLFRIEGGYSNHKDDSGGATKYGITQKTFERWCKMTGAEPYDVRFLSKHTAHEIYRDFYWDLFKINEINNDEYATIFFDQLINSDPSTVVRTLQRSINKTVRGVNLVVDGSFGPKTRNAFNKSHRLTMLDFIMRRQDFYVDLAQRRPKDITFLGGWIARTHNLLEILFY